MSLLEASRGSRNPTRRKMTLNGSDQRVLVIIKLILKMVSVFGSQADAFLKPIKDRQNLEVLCNAHVRKIVIKY